MRYIPICILALCLSACGSKKDQQVQETAPEDVLVQEVQENRGELLVTDDVERDDEEVQEETTCQTLELNFTPEPETQIVSILGHYVDGNCLIIKYQHSGCSEGNLILGHQKESDDSDRLRLYVKDAGPCEMLVHGTAAFNIPEGMNYILGEGSEE